MNIKANYVVQTVAYIARLSVIVGHNIISCIATFLDLYLNICHIATKSFSQTGEGDYLVVRISESGTMRGAMRSSSYNLLPVYILWGTEIGKGNHFWLPKSVWGDQNCCYRLLFVFGSAKKGLVNSLHQFCSANPHFLRVNNWPLMASDKRQRAINWCERVKIRYVMHRSCHSHQFTALCCLSEAINGQLLTPQKVGICRTKLI